MRELCVLDSATGRGIHLSPRIGTSSLGRLPFPWKPALFASNPPDLSQTTGSLRRLASTVGYRSLSGGLRSRNTFIRPEGLRLCAEGPEHARQSVEASSCWISRFSAGLNPESTEHRSVSPGAVLGWASVYSSRSAWHGKNVRTETAGCTNRLTITPHSHRSRHFWPRAAEKRPQRRELHCIVVATTWLQEG